MLTGDGPAGGKQIPEMDRFEVMARIILQSRGTKMKQGGGEWG